MQPPCIPETRILRPRPASLTNSDDWPEFELSDTRVISPETNEPVSLFHAAEHYPLTITGTLQPLTSRNSHCYQRGAGGTRTVNIELNNVLQFAYGQYTNGRPVVWAAGQAGWFTITPSRAYSPIYNEMSKAVSMLYFVADAYRNSPKMTAPELFQLYAREELKKPKASTEAAQEVYRHRHFLLACMFGRKEDLKWSKLSLYTHFQQKFPEDFATVRERLASPPLKAKKSSRPSSDVDSTTSSKRKRGRPAKGQGADAMSVDSSVISVSHSQRGAKGRNAAAAQNRRHRSRSDAVASPKPEYPTVQEPVTPLQEDEDDDDDEMETSDSDAGLLGARRARKGQSALRPKASKASKGRKGPPKDDNDEDDDDANESNAPSPTSRKRKSDIPHRRSKRHLTTDNDASSDEDEDETVGGASPESSPLSSPDATTPLSSTVLPHHLKESRDPIQEDTFLCPLVPCTHKIFDVDSPLAQRLIDEHLASHKKAANQSKPNGHSNLNPNGTVVDDDDQRIQLVRKLQAPSLPAGRLMEKVLGVHNAASTNSAEGIGLVEGSRVAGTRFPSNGMAVGQGVVVRY